MGLSKLHCHQSLLLLLHLFFLKLLLFPRHFLELFLVRLLFDPGFFIVRGFPFCFFDLHLLHFLLILKHIALAELLRFCACFAGHHSIPVSQFLLFLFLHSENALSTILCSLLLFQHVRGHYVGPHLLALNEARKLLHLFLLLAEARISPVLGQFDPRLLDKIVVVCLFEKLRLFARISVIC